MVNAATGTVPHACAHASGPSSFPINQSASGADSVSFQSLAGRMTAPAASSTTRACCWAATLMALTGGVPASWRAARSADHQVAGSCSERGGWVGSWSARPSSSSSPVSASRTSTFVDCVEESTPITTGTPPSLLLVQPGP
jgi:hypothetical protein